MYIPGLAYRHISKLFLQTESRNNDTSVAASTPSTHILVSNTVLQQKEHNSLKQRLILGLGQEMYKAGLEHLSQCWK